MQRMDVGGGTILAAASDGARIVSGVDAGEVVMTELGSSSRPRRRSEAPLDRSLPRRTRIATARISPCAATTPPSTTCSPSKSTTATPERLSPRILLIATDCCGGLACSSCCDAQTKNHEMSK